MAKSKFNIDKSVVMDSLNADISENINVSSKKTKISTPEEIPESKKKLTKKDTHKVYSFWANKEQIEVWKCYQEANSELEKAEDLGLKAISEYIANHPLQGIEADVYDLRLKSKGLEESIYR